MKRKTLISLLISIFIIYDISAQPTFDTYFDDATMRVDYFHSGDSDEEHFAPDRILNDGPWSGSQKYLTDPLMYGLYAFEVYSLETNELIFSQGFASIFGEWQTIPEAKTQWGTYHESIRFPWPKKDVQLVVLKRDDKNVFQKLWIYNISPTSRKVNPSVAGNSFNVFDVLVNGEAHNKVDLVILGDGYTAGEMKKFHADATRLTNALFEVEPFKSRKNDFNVRAIDTPSESSGVNRPHPGDFKRSALSVSYSAFDSERYALAYDNRTIRNAAATAPYDFMVILINEKTYGGGGIFRLYTTVAVDNKFSDYIMVHELGHHFAALADEYYSSSVSYEVGEIAVEPWEANITALFDKDNLKWGNMVKPNTPLPTPWEKENYDKFSYSIQKERKEMRKNKVPESDMEALFERERKRSTEILENMEHSHTVGAFEGGGYMQYGMYRPYPDCIMFTRNHQVFCPVCQNAIEQMIDLYVK